MGHKLPMERERQLLQVVQSLVDADARAREAAVAAAMAEDPAYGTALQRVLERLVTDDRDEQLAQPAAESDSGERLGPWRLHERIGSGGMGDVYRASRDDGAFQREVALKRIWSGGASPLAGRLARERDTLARLQHPHIAQLLDAGIDPHGQPWFAMELVDGQPITRWCDAHAADLRLRVRCLEQLCDAVEFAHRHLIVHRDLKPGNVLVDAAGNVKLLDFGIAKVLEEGDAQATQTLAMTPAWAAPEQRSGAAVTTAVDIWQLGQLLRLLLCGSHPAEGAIAPSTVIGRLRRDDPGQAQARAQARHTTPALLQRQLRGDLDSIVAHATRDAPGQRYASPAALAADLRAWRAGDPVLARRHERGYRARRWARRWWPALAAMLAAILFAAYHIDALNAGLRREQALRRNAEIAQQEATRQRDRAVLLADYFATLFKHADARDIARGDVSAATLLERSVAQLRDTTDMPVQTRAELLGAAARAFGLLHRQAEEKDAQMLAIRLLEADPNADPVQLAMAYLEAGTTANAAYDGKTAALWQTRAEQLIRTRGVTDVSVRVRLAQLDANQANLVNDFPRAAAAYRQIIQLGAQTHGDPRTRISLASAMVNLARLPVTSDAEAESLLRRGEALLLDSQPLDKASLYPLRSALVTALARQGKLDEAAALGERLLGDVEAFYTPDDPWLSIIRNVISRVALWRGDLPRALALAEQAANGAHGHFPPTAAPARRMALDAAVARLYAGDATRADAWLQRARGAPLPRDQDRWLLQAAQAWAACQRADDLAARAALAAQVKAAAALPAQQRLYRPELWMARCRSHG